MSYYRGGSKQIILSEEEIDCQIDMGNNYYIGMSKQDWFDYIDKMYDDDNTERDYRVGMPVCTRCGKRYILDSSRYKKYCSARCYRAATRKHIARANSKWPEILNFEQKELYLNNKCVDCGELLPENSPKNKLRCEKCMFKRRANYVKKCR